MKVIDLLNAIAGIGTIPYRIYYNENVYEYDGETQNYYKSLNFTKDWLIGEDITAILNDEVEIIEEPKKIKRLEEEVNKQAEIIQWYEKENRHNQEIIIDLSKRIDKTTQAIDELLSYDDFKDITNAIFGNVKEELKYYLSNYKTLEEFRKANLESKGE